MWFGNFGDPGSVSKFSPDGTPLSPDTGFSQGNISKAQGTVADQQGNIWIANVDNDTLTKFPRGNPNRARNFTGGGLNAPFDIAIDASGDVWVTNSGGDSVSKFTPDGMPVKGSPFTGGEVCCSPKGIAIDSRGNAWVANFADASVTALRPNGKPYRRPPFRGGGIDGPWGIAVDGKDNIWVANFAGRTLSHLCGATRSNCPAGLHTGDPISPPTGYGSTSNALQRLTAVTIDSSGNVWVANNFKPQPTPPEDPGGDGLVVFIGLAAPVRTPLIGPPRQP